MDELQQVLSEGNASEAELSRMQQGHQQLNRAVQQLEERKRASMSNPDDKLAMFRQQANLVAKKRDALLQRLSTVSRERAAVEAELQDKAEQLKSVVPVLKGDDFRKYASELRGKTAQYKRMKAELSELRSEWGIISRTTGLLKAQDDELAARLGEAEARRGVSGFAQTQEDLEKISQQKAEIDEMKGRTLDEMSHVVGEINERIKRRKHDLAPQIVKLRKLRNEVREQEASYLEKKTSYTNAKAGIDSDLANVQSEAEAALKEAALEESAASYYESAASVERVKLERAEEERAGRFHRTMPDGREMTSYRELYADKVRQQEQLSKEMRERQKRIKENHGGNSVQVKVFRDLHRLLRSKIEAQQRARAEANEMMQAEGQDTNVFTMDE
jgi:intraflagellar transport protein 81